MFASEPDGSGLDSACHGAWRSLVAHSAGGRAVAGSNPVAPIPAGKHCSQTTVAVPPIAQALPAQPVMSADVLSVNDPLAPKDKGGRPVIVHAKPAESIAD
jgi:hypothetical protein